MKVLNKSIIWLTPGLRVKRWFALIFIGTVLMTIGILILFDIKPVFYTMQFISFVMEKNKLFNDG